MGCPPAATFVRTVEVNCAANGHRLMGATGVECLSPSHISFHCRLNAPEHVWRAPIAHQPPPPPTNHRIFCAIKQTSTMQGPSSLSVATGLLLGIVLSYVGIWKQIFFFSKTDCADSDDSCQCVDFKKAMKPAAITVGLSFLLVWAAPNIWSAMSGGGDYYY